MHVTRRARLTTWAALLALAAGCTAPATTSEREESAQPAGPGGPNPVVVMDTSMGPIKIELFQDKSPTTVKNFLAYVDDKHFDNTIFHRVISDFMIQGGGFGTDYKEKPTKAPIRNEAGNGLSNKRGTLAMARTSDPNSATAQFFINAVDNGYRLDPGPRVGAGYAVFGKVIEGMDVVDKIREVKTTVKPLTMLDKQNGEFVTAPSKDVPEQEVVIKSVRRVEK
jgi:cyclophilin family peptidyl-prolyl cis-trans isomerase